MPVTERYRPDPRHPELGSLFYDPVPAADFPQHILRFRNDRWAARVGLEALSEAEWIEHFGRFAPLPDNLGEPLALRYHGHQFRVYNPDLGDGRGFLFAQMRDAEDGRLLDLGTKGSGQTPWSRSGDGRLTLKGGVREILATETLEARGVPTSKTFSLIETGEKLYRGDEPSPTRSAVMVRLSHSHIRIGTFQRLRAQEEVEAIRRLVDYCLAVYHPQAADRATIADANDAPALLYEAVVQAVAELGAAWFAAGFVHGVLNTDNIVITGESFDYGPWRFLERYDPHFTAAYFDHGGLYAYGRQAEALHWNLARLAECLLPLTPVERLEPIYQSFSERFDKALVAQTFYRLGLAVKDAEAARTTAHALWAALHETEAPFERVFFDLTGGARPERLAESPLAELYANEPWTSAIEAVRTEAPSPHLQGPAAQAFWAQRAPEDMLIDEVESLWSAIDREDDWAPLEAKVARLREVGAATPPPDGPPDGSPGG
ncbi:MAG: YdiU family protein [Marivibrio sp.]|uniref:protein adenylyltransferase SelO n=1 Tax=Marivibrio sp. TaxID=2039719 RepID=UPI0032EC3707